ncbi:MAG: DUF5723 family protein [Balneolaceae bacterium]
MYRRFSAPIFFCFFLFLLSAGLNRPVTGQLLHTPSSLGTGGGGTAYITGYESLFINPANLALHRPEIQVRVSTGAFGFMADTPIHSNSIRELRSYYLELTEGYTPGTSPEQRFSEEHILNRNYQTGQLTSEHPSGGEIHWFGVHWQRAQKSFALSGRTRFANRFSVGRGFYDSEPVLRRNEQVIDRSLSHSFQVLHELSFGYAENFSLLSGLIPRLNRIVVGIAPKAVIPGAMLHLENQDRLTWENGRATGNRKQQLSHLSSGPLSTTFQEQQESTGLSGPLNRDALFSPTGIGAGVDMGITLMIPLGNDLLLANDMDEHRRRMFTIGGSVTDLGFVRYRKKPVTLLNQQTTETNVLPGVANRLFMGRPGEHYNYLYDHSNGLYSESTPEEDAIYMLLPTSLNGGMLLQIGRLKLMGDLSLGLGNSAFNTTRLVTYLGMEIRPLSFLPIRAGTRLAPDLSDYYTLGTAIETGWIELGFSVQFRSHSGRPGGELAGAGIGSLRVRLP